MTNGHCTDGTERTEIEQNTRDLRDYLSDVRDEKQEALERGDDKAANYAAGKESGLIAGIAALEELVDDD